MEKKESKYREMPAARALKLLSWIVALGGVVIGGIVSAQGMFGKQSGIAGALLVLLSVVFAVGLRMFGSIGQMLFEFKGLFGEYILPIKNDLAITKSLNSDIKVELKNTTADLQKQRNTINTHFHDLLKRLDESNSAIEKILLLRQEEAPKIENLEQQQIQQRMQIACDLKDINQHIYEIKQFFEQISQRLEMHG